MHTYAQTFGVFCRHPVTRHFNSIMFHAAKVQHSFISLSVLGLSWPSLALPVLCLTFFEEQAVSAIRDYIEEGGDFEGGYNEDIEDYQGKNPEIRAEQYITHAMLDVYLDQDEDQEYIATGIRADMRKRYEEADEEAELAGRFEMSGEVEESETNNGTEYREPLTIDGKYVAEKVDSPDEKGHYTGSSYEYNGQKFGGLRELIDYRTTFRS